MTSTTRLLVNKVSGHTNSKDLMDSMLIIKTLNQDNKDVPSNHDNQFVNKNRSKMDPEGCK